MPPNRRNRPDPTANVAVQTEADHVDRQIAARQARALESIARDVRGLRHLAWILVRLMHSGQADGGMTDAEKAEIASDVAATKAKLATMAGSLDDEAAALEQTGVEPAK